MCQFSDKAICFQSSPIKWIVALNLHAQKYLHTHTNLNCICSMILILHNRNIHTLRVLINVEVLNKVLGNHLQEYRKFLINRIELIVLMAKYPHYLVGSIFVITRMNIRIRARP